RTWYMVVASTCSQTTATTRPLPAIPMTTQKKIPESNLVPQSGRCEQRLLNLLKRKLLFAGRGERLLGPQVLPLRHHTNVSRCLTRGPNPVTTRRDGSPGRRHP